MSASIFLQFCRLEVSKCIGYESGNAPPILYFPSSNSSSFSLTFARIKISPVSRESGWVQQWYHYVPRIHPVVSRVIRNTKPTRSEIKEETESLRHIYLGQEVQ